MRYAKFQRTYLPNMRITSHAFPFTFHSSCWERSTHVSCSSFGLTHFTCDRIFLQQLKTMIDWTHGHASHPLAHTCLTPTLRHFKVTADWNQLLGRKTKYIFIHGRGTMQRGRKVLIGITISWEEKWRSSFCKVTIRPTVKTSMLWNVADNN
jgi:hypothetical protein